MAVFNVIENQAVGRNSAKFGLVTCAVRGALFFQTLWPGARSCPGIFRPLHINCTLPRIPTSNSLCSVLVNINTFVVPGLKPDVIVSPQADIYLPAGSNVKLDCKAKGIPIPDLRWFKDGTQLQMWPRSRKWHLDSDGLTISGVTINDQGFYQCMAHNK